MSQHHTIHNVHLAESSRTSHGGLLTLTALLLGGLALPASAQNRLMALVAPQRNFTVPPDVPTAVVLQAEPDAACDLHPVGVNDKSQTMRLYGNIEGYVQFHFTPRQDIQDAYLQLDCTTQEAVTTHPVHLRIAASPTEDTPAPEGSVPAPKGSKIRPALTDEAARQLSDEEIIAQGYPPRPNAMESPEAYARWLGRVSHPMTILPSHSVARSDVSHALSGVTGVTEGPSAQTNDHWSGFVAQGPSDSFRAVEGLWTVPSPSCLFYVISGWNPTCYSSAWAGLDGLPSNDVVQAGTEHDAVSTSYGAFITTYAWTEAWPQQPTAHEIFTVSPGDVVYAYVYVGDSAGNINPSGGYAWFTVEDETHFKLFIGSTKLGTSFGFSATSAEWIVERPWVNDGFPEFSAYGSIEMTAAYVLPATGSTMIPYSKAVSVQLTMRNKGDAPSGDNNVLSTVKAASCSECMWFYWKNFN